MRPGGTATLNPRRYIALHTLLFTAQEWNLVRCAASYAEDLLGNDARVRIACEERGVMWRWWLYVCVCMCVCVLVCVRECVCVFASLCACV